jgi:hypothetical protein
MKGGIIYPTRMVKTTLYLPDDLKRDLERVAKRRGISEAELYRQALRAATVEEVPKPEVGFLDSGRKPGEPGMARRVDELLDETGFGEW